MNKANKILKVVTAAAIAIASVIMIILSIVDLANGRNPTTDDTLPFRIIACVLLIFASILSTCLVVSKDPRHFDSRLVVYNGILLGTGIFVVLDAAAAVAAIFVTYLIPCILIGLGAFFVVASVISLANKINKKNTDIASIILGAILLTAGILLVCFAGRTTELVMWLIIGVILLAASIVAMVNAIKKVEEDKPEEPKKKEAVDAPDTDTESKN